MQNNGKDAPGNVIVLAGALGVSVDVARRNVEFWGRGHIYAAHWRPQGAKNVTAFRDTPEHRRQLLELYERVAVLHPDGTVTNLKRTRPENTRAERKRKSAAGLRAARESARRLEREYREAKETEAAYFKAGQENTAGKKRQGRGNAHSDIGLYAPIRPAKKVTDTVRGKYGLELTIPE